MKLLLILPYDTTYRYKTAFVPSISYQPLTLSVLASLVPPEYDVDITLVDEGVQSFDYRKDNYDIVGISIVTSSANRGYELARYFKSKGSYVLIGGHHATLMPEEAAMYADTVFIGNSETTFPQFLHDFMKNKPQKAYQANGYNLQGLPFPRRDLMKSNRYLKQPTIIANYGCSNSCNYCVINSFWNTNAKRPVQDVISEIKTLGKKEYLFLDPSPLSDKDYAKELFTELAKLNIKWAGLSTLDIADDIEMLELAAKSGCSGILLGFETFCQDNLIEARKTKNNTARYKKIIEKIHYYDIAVLGTFMLGFDNDTKESLSCLTDQIMDIKVDVPRFAIATPFPNTPFYNSLNEQGRILTKNWNLYDSIQCVYQPQNMQPKELEYLFVKAWKDSYSYKHIFERFNFTKKNRLITLATNLGMRFYAQKIEKILIGKQKLK